MEQPPIEDSGGEVHNDHKFGAANSLLLLSRCGVCNTFFSRDRASRKDCLQCSTCGLLVHNRCATPALYCNPFHCKKKEPWFSALASFVSPSTRKKENQEEPALVMEPLASTELTAPEAHTDLALSPNLRRSLLRQSLDEGNISVNEFFAAEEGNEDVLFHIFSFLDVSDLIQGRLTCKKWKNMIDDDTYWRYRGFRFCTPGMGVYLFDVHKDHKKSKDKLFTLKSKPMATIGLCGPADIVEEIVNFWVGDQLPTKVLLSSWDKTESFLPEVRGIVKAQNRFVSFKLKICTNFEKVSLLKHCDGFIVAFDMANGVPMDEDMGTTYDETKMREKIKEHAATLGIPLVMCLLGYKRLLTEEPVEERQPIAEADINLDDEDTTDGDWVIVKEDHEESNRIITLSNQRSAMIALMHIFERVRGATHGFSLVPSNNPSWDEPGQRDLSLQGRVHEAMVLMPQHAADAGRVACSTALFVGEVVVIVPTYAAVGGLGGMALALKSGVLPLILLAGGVGAVLGLCYGAYEGIRIGYNDAKALYEQGWSNTEAGKWIKF